MYLVGEVEIELVDMALMHPDFLPQRGGVLDQAAATMESLEVIRATVARLRRKKKT